MACHLKEHKGVANVINAFHEAFSEKDDVRLLIAGDGNERKHLEKIVIDLQESSRISFIGRYSRSDITRIFTQADAFVLVSEVEPFGIVYIEALMCGLPCIGTAGQGAEDIIDDSNGIKVEYGDIESLANAMRKIYSEISAYNPQLIRQQCMEKFSYNSVCQQIEGRYATLVQKS